MELHGVAWFVVPVLPRDIAQLYAQTDPAAHLALLLHLQKAMLSPCTQWDTRKIAKKATGTQLEAGWFDITAQPQESPFPSIMLLSASGYAHNDNT